MFLYNINIPLNNEGINELESYDEKMINVKTFSLSEDEFNFLRKKKGLFALYEKEFDIIIDICEEERIGMEQIPNAIIIAENYKRTLRNEIEISICNTIIESFHVAKQAGTFWEIGIYLE